MTGKRDPLGRQRFEEFYLRMMIPEPDNRRGRSVEARRRKILAKLSFFLPPRRDDRRADAFHGDTFVEISAADTQAIGRSNVIIRRISIGSRRTEGCDKIFSIRARDCEPMAP